MRDLYSLIAAIYASETGHALFSTLHTQSPIGSLRRMEHFGIDRHLLADAALITGLIGQRLVPLLCEKCRIPWQVKAPELDGETRARRKNTAPWRGYATPANSSSVITRAVLTARKRCR